MERNAHRQYTADLKAHAVLLSLSLGIAGPARKLGISAKSLANLVRLDRDGQPLSNAKRRSVGEIEAKNSRLRAENATQRMERDVLKKSMVRPLLASARLEMG